jgi:hypothetical protein
MSGSSTLPECVVQPTRFAGKFKQCFAVHADFVSGTWPYFFEPDQEWFAAPLFCDMSTDCLFTGLDTRYVRVHQRFLMLKNLLESSGKLEPREHQELDIPQSNDSTSDITSLMTSRSPGGDTFATLMLVLVFLVYQVVDELKS